MTHTRRILVVDDNSDHVVLTVDAIESLGADDVEIRIAHDGREALQVLCEERWVPGLLLLDIQMPFVDGFDVLEHIKADDDLRLLPVVMLTSSADERDICRSYGLGTDSFVTKPVAPQALRELVSRIPHQSTDANASSTVEVN
jgi:CheY-like chemotaxis protein